MVVWPLERIHKRLHVGGRHPDFVEIGMKYRLAVDCIIFPLLIVDGTIGKDDIA
jgi:hypothetical protein